MGHRKDERLRASTSLATVILILILIPAGTGACDGDDAAGEPLLDAALDGGNPDGDGTDPAVAEAKRMVEEGREVFRFDTFGSEAFWGGQLRLHEAIAGEALGGVGDGISPEEALALGLKVDVEALPESVKQALAEGDLDLRDPAVTLELLRLDAVIGITGVFDEDELTAVGIQCSLCHSTVDDSFAPGVGRRLDGWPNRDLDVGAVIAAAPNLEPFAELLDIEEATVRDVVLAWGPGKFDAELILDGKAFRPDGKTAATLIPAAFGLAGVNLHTYTGWGSVPHWNALVANLEMGGQGTFFDPRLRDSEQFPVAAAAGLDDVRAEPDLVTEKLPALQMYQLAIPVPEPPPETFDAEAAERGAELFRGKADCARCHVPPLFTEPGWNLHTPEEIGIDSFQADRSPTRRYRTTPLGGLFTRLEGGFYHDGRFASLEDVVNHYDETFELGLSSEERADLIQYLLSL